MTEWRKEWLEVNLEVEVRAGEGKGPYPFKITRLRDNALFLETQGVNRSTDLSFGDGDEIQLSFSSAKSEDGVSASAFVVRLGNYPGRESPDAPHVFMGVKLSEDPETLYHRLGVIEASPEQPPTPEAETSSPEELKPEETSPEAIVEAETVTSPSSPPVVAAPDESSQAEGDEVAYHHRSREDYEELIPRLLRVTPSELGRLSDFDRQVRNLILGLSRAEREIIANCTDPKTTVEPQSPEHYQFRMLLLSIRMSMEIGGLRKISRSTSGTLSTLIERVVEAFQTEMKELEDEVTSISQRLLSTPEDIERFKVLNRKLGALEQQFSEYRVFHYAQVLRDTQQGSHPRPLEVLSLVQPRALSSYVKMLEQPPPQAGHQPRKKRAQVLNECLRLYSTWTEELENEGADPAQLSVLVHGLALTGKIAVEAKGLRLLMNDTDYSLFMNHVGQLYQQDRLAYTKFQGELRNQLDHADSKWKAKLEELTRRLDHAFQTFSDLVGHTEVKVDASAHYHQPVRYERPLPGYETDKQKRRTSSPWKIRVPLRFSWQLGAVVFFAFGFLVMNWTTGRMKPIEVAGYEQILPLQEVYRQKGIFVGAINRTNWLALSRFEQAERSAELRSWAQAIQFDAIKIIDLEGRNLVTTQDNRRGGELVFWTPR